MSAAPPSPWPATPAQSALGDLHHELDTTRRVLERVPDARWDWKPHEKSMSLGQLAAHVANLLLWGVHTMAEDHVDFASPPALPPRPADRAGLLAAWDANAARLLAAVGAADAESLGATYTVRRGERVFMAMPRAAMVRAMVLSHVIHHRGQLTVYFRLLDVPVPPVYGPTADEGAF